MRGRTGWAGRGVGGRGARARVAPHLAQHPDVCAHHASVCRDAEPDVARRVVRINADGDLVFGLVEGPVDVECRVRLVRLLLQRLCVLEIVRAEPARVDGAHVLRSDAYGVRRLAEDAAARLDLDGRVGVPAHERLRGGRRQRRGSEQCQGLRHPGGNGLCCRAAVLRCAAAVQPRFRARHAPPARVVDSRI